jgi:hypothetical protein
MPSSLLLADTFWLLTIIRGLRKVSSLLLPKPNILLRLLALLLDLLEDDSAILNNYEYVPEPIFGDMAIYIALNGILVSIQCCPS